jgi:hypothetical protein
MKFFRNILTATIFLSILFSGTAIFAQTQTAPTAPPSTATQRYNPNSNQSNTNSFGGSTFSGIGGVVAGCANIGGRIMNGLNTLFKSVVKIETVPVSDATTQNQLKNLNNTEQCLNGIAYAVAKSLLQQVSNKTLNWINTGFNGNPLYVRDVSSYMKSIRDEQLQKYIQYVPSSNPIFGNAIRSAITKQVTGKDDGLLKKVMNTPEGIAYENFQDDFTKGGWDFLLNQNNNPIGALFNAADELSGSIAEQQENTRDELQRNSGFLDMKRCAEYANDGRVQNGNSAPVCLRYETVTPGSIIAEQAISITNSPIRQLEYADSLNEVLGSFFDQLLNRLFSQGLGALRGRNTGTSLSTGPGFNTVFSTSGAPIGASFPGGGLGYQLSGSGYDSQDFDISRPQHIRAITQAQYDFENRALDSLAIANRLVPTLGALDYCLPGPNPTWEQDLAENYQALMGSLETPSPSNSRVLSILSAISPLLGGGSATFNNALIGEPILNDKTTGEPQKIKPVTFVSTNKNSTAIDIEAFFKAGIEQLIKEYRVDFSKDRIINAFVSVDANQNYARGAIKDALKEVSNLPQYNQNLIAMNTEYNAALNENADALSELESIRQEVNQIVKVAKARYISEQAAAGTPVNMACINQAYVIDESPIRGVPRLEPVSPDPAIQQSNDASEYFYSNL